MGDGLGKASGSPRHLSNESLAGYMEWIAMLQKQGKMRTE